MINYRPSATLIISVYKNIDNLGCILSALRHQTCESFDIIISEDGESEEMASFLMRLGLSNKVVRHLTQADLGFRKTRALNRAVMASRTNYLIFIDGDCVPHPRFVEAHMRHARPKRVCVGRRVELGPCYSREIIENPDIVQQFASKVGFLRHLPSLLRDGVKNPESALYSPLLQLLRSNKRTRLLGCNFSCFRADLERVNGFNEEYVSIGTGEDSDIDWRLTASGCKNYDIKHLAPLFHLHHDRVLPPASENGMILERSQRLNLWRCKSGLTNGTDV